MVYINSTPDNQNKVAKAHKVLLDTLSNLDEIQYEMKDPEMMETLVNASLKKFFEDSDYQDIVDLLRSINTYY